MADQPPSLLSFEEYMAFEAASPVKHEYVGGTVHAMAGASRRHNEVSGGIFALLLPAARAHGCRLFVTDMKLRTPLAMYYPDVMAVCSPPPDDEFYEDSSCLLVEVLSASTRHIDQREKLAAYRQTETLQTYLIVDPDLERFIVHARGEDGKWTVSLLGPAESAAIPCLQMMLGVDEVFRL